MKKSTSRKTTKLPAKGKQASGLYQSPRESPRNYKPNYRYSATDTYKAVSQYDRVDYISLARRFYTKCPDLGGALIQKSSWVVGPGSFTPVYTGQNSRWGDLVEDWLVNQWMPVCSVMGKNYCFRTCLNLSSVSIDVDGDTGMILTSTRDNFPQIQLIPSHRIGNRYLDTEIIKEGKYQGYTQIDGCILKGGKIIGYNILGDEPEDDVKVSITDLQLLYEPEWSDQYRGISRIARSITDWASQDEINEFLIRGVKLASSIGIIHKTETGEGEGSAFAPGAEEDTAAGASGVTVSAVNGGEIYFLKANVGESIEGLKDERPSPNTEQFLSRIQKRALYSLGWPQELLDPSKIGGASVRLIQDLARRAVATRQVTIERRARLMINFAVAKAMKEGIIPQNDTDWWRWSFTKGSVLSVDNGYEAQIDRDNLKLGVTTVSEIVNKRGLDWYELREQSQKEVEDLIDRAQAIARSKNIPFETALTLLQQSTPNQAPVPIPPAESAPATNE